MNISIAIQIITYLIANRQEISKLILGMQDLFPDSPGEEKASAVRGFIGAATNLTDKIEAAWPVVQPIFNLFVAKVKGK